MPSVEPSSGLKVLSLGEVGCGVGGALAESGPPKPNLPPNPRPSGFHEKDGKAYCRKDYFDMFAPKCGGCARAILENYISALNTLWHPECFVCRVRSPVAFSGGAESGPLRGEAAASLCFLKLTYRARLRFLIRWEGRQRTPSSIVGPGPGLVQGLRETRARQTCAAAPGSGQVQEKGM